MPIGLLAIPIVMFVLALIALGIFLFVFWILMIIDCATRKFKNDTDKIVWILLLIFLHALGAILYYFIIYNKRKKN